MDLKVRSQANGYRSMKGNISGHFVLNEKFINVMKLKYILCRT